MQPLVFISFLKATTVLPLLPNGLIIQPLTKHLQTSQERELWTFANLNLAIVYLRALREHDFMLLMDRIAPGVNAIKHFFLFRHCLSGRIS
jgi:hypothetical protein